MISNIANEFKSKSKEALYILPFRKFFTLATSSIFQKLAKIQLHDLSRDESMVNVPRNFIPGSLQNSALNSVGLNIANERLVVTG
ncbi:unnamed protein product [Rhizophagus irregularis]|nr:unnamed protein product [Rhizophagus irregularis]